MRDLSKLKELEDWFAERERNFPEWWREQRERARKIFREKEERGEPIGKYGVDFDPLEYIPNPPPKRPLVSLEELGEGERRAAESVGTSSKEERVGSHLQEDATVTYRRLMEGKGVLVETPEEAVLHYPWLRQFVHGLIPIDLDKYTAFCSGFSLGGAFVWVKEGARVDLPLSACFILETKRVAQLPYILVLASPYSKINILSGCTLAPSCRTALHGCVTEIYVGRRAEVTFNLIHNFRPGFHVRPKVGVMVEEGGTYIENYVELGEPSSSQLYPTVILKGENSRAELRSFFFGRGKSDLDVGGGLLLVGEGSRGEVVSRTVVTDEARVRMRGMLKGYGKGVLGHLECRGLLLSGRADVRAFPNLSSLQPDANLTHEAAVGRIEEEHLNYLMSRGIPRDQATSLIITGFLDIAGGLPEHILAWMKGLISRTARELM